jgi:CubicO group peptidase (beta-lactamase class C family)
MRRIIVFLTTAFVLALVALPFGAHAAPSAAPDYNGIDSFVQSTMQNRGVPGVDLAIIHGDQVEHLRGYGGADPSGRAVTPETPFLIGSNTKGFTALAIMQLVEQGRIDLDAPVQHYLPWFRVADGDTSSAITVQQLLNHTSGIPESALYSAWADPDLTLAAYARQMATVLLDRPVGSGYEYSNANYNILGLIVETVSGEPYAGYIQQHIFAPLDMTHSAATESAQRRLGLAEGYHWWFGLGPLPAHEQYIQSNLPSAFLASTAVDLSHYLVAQMNGGRYGSAQVLSADGIARMHTPGPNTQGGTVAGYGMGWASTSINGVPFVTHDGTTLSFKSIQLIDTQNNWGVILLTNASNQLPSNDEPYRALYTGIVSRLEGWDLPSGPTLQTQYTLPAPD